MKKDTRFVGLDVHAETIAVAVSDKPGEAQSLGTIPNQPEAVRKLIKKLGPVESLRVCYEAGPCGYILYWLLTQIGVFCEVIAPTLIPVKAGDRIKTDRRDALKLARCYRSGDLTPVWVPDAAHEALRDLVRAREAAKKDQLRARHRLGKFLLRRGLRFSSGKAWTQKHMIWVKQQRFDNPAQEATFQDYLMEAEHMQARIRRLEQAIDEAIAAAPEPLKAVMAALQGLRGVAKVTAATIVAEGGDLTRFEHATQLMGYSGAVSSESSSGGKQRRGAITKTGNAHLRRVIVEAAWHYQYQPRVMPQLHKRQQGLSEPIKEICWKAQQRLHRRFFRLLAKGKAKQQAATAVGRELLGFIWAIGMQCRREQESRAAAQPGAGV